MLSFISIHRSVPEFDPVLVCNSVTVVLIRKLNLLVNEANLMRTPSLIVSKALSALSGTVIIVYCLTVLVLKLLSVPLPSAFAL